jgi:hypothetical protein
MTDRTTGTATQRVIERPRVPANAARGLGLVMLSGVLFVVIALPSLTFAWHGLSLAGAFEESVGYRYFYTLRHLYSGERPFMPQGHAMGLVHMGIHLVLTALGHPPSELYPRIDLWIRIASLVPFVLAGVAYAWAAAALGRWPARLLLAAFVCFVTYNERLPWGWQASPDYMAWVIPVSLVTVGALVRVLTHPPTERLAPFLWLGVFAGACLGLKATYAVFPLAIGCTMLARRFSIRTMLGLGISIALATVTFVLILSAYYLFDRQPLAEWLETFRQFTATQRMTLPDTTYNFKSWRRSMQWQNALDFAPWILVIAGAVLLAGVWRRTRIAVALAPAMALAIYILYARFYTMTLIETCFAAVAVGTALAVVIGRALPIPDLVKLAGAAALFAPVSSVILPTEHFMLGGYRIYSDADVRLHQAMAEAGGVTVSLVPTNAYRLMSVESAICKGSFNLLHNVPPSPFMTALFPDRACLPSAQPLDDSVNLLSLRAGNETLENAFQRAAAVYGVELSARGCEEIPSIESYFVFCSRRNAGLRHAAPE